MLHDLRLGLLCDQHLCNSPVTPGVPRHDVLEGIEGVLPVQLVAAVRHAPEGSAVTDSVRVLLGVVFVFRLILVEKAGHVKRVVLELVQLVTREVLSHLLRPSAELGVFGRLVHRVFLNHVEPCVLGNHLPLER